MFIKLENTRCFTTNQIVIDAYCQMLGKGIVNGFSVMSGDVAAGVCDIGLNSCYLFGKSAQIISDSNIDEISEREVMEKFLLHLTMESSIKETVSEQFAECIKRTPVSTECKWDLKGQGQEKPRTKVEYEKVEFKPNEIWKAFKEHQEVGYLYVNTSDGFECLFDGVFNLAMAISQGDQLYRKVERPVEWWDDAVEYIQSLNGEANPVRMKDEHGENEVVTLNISVVLAEREAKDLARIILEQEGE